jgi:prepilin-type processing-associated H-X9-DG protein
MSEPSPSPASDGTPAARRPLQFDLWVLAELVVGAAIVSALCAEFGGLGVVFSAVGAMTLASGLYVVRGQTAESQAERVLTVAAVMMVPPCTCMLLLPMVSRAQPAARRAQCTSNLRQIAFALHNYHDTYDCFPPPYIVGPDGKPWHSWRVLILPYLNEQALYDHYDFSEAWDGPNNSLLATMMPPYFACPSHANIAPGVTDYYYVVGGDRWRLGTERVNLSQVASADGAGHTILLIESHTVGGNWMAPGDLRVNEVLRGINQDFQNPSATAAHGAAEEDPRKGVGGINVAMFDGSVKHLPATADHDGLNALLTIHGGEDMENFMLEPSEPEPERVAWWLLLIEMAFVVIVVYRHRPRNGSPG